MEEKSKKQKCRELFMTYFSAMLFAFTGGNMTWPLVQQKLEYKYKLMDREKSLEYFALGQSLPGILSLNTAILIGREVAGWAGGIAAAMGNIVPAFFGMLIMAVSYTAVSRLEIINSLIGGIRAASIAVIFVNALATMQRAKSKADILLVAFALAATLLLGWNILLVVGICGVLGVVKHAVIKYRKQGTDKK